MSSTPSFEIHFAYKVMLSLRRITGIGVSETGSTKVVSAIDVCIGDVGLILHFRIGFAL